MTYLGVDADGRVDPEAVARAIRGRHGAGLDHGGQRRDRHAAADPGDRPGHPRPRRAVSRRCGRRRGPRAARRRRLPHRPAHHVVQRSVRAAGRRRRSGYAPIVKLAPQTVGGGQEQGYRAGTENLPAIAGMGVAADLARVEVAGEAARLSAAARSPARGPPRPVPEARLTGARGPARLPHHVSIVVPGVEGGERPDGAGPARHRRLVRRHLHGDDRRAVVCAARDRLRPAVAEGSLCFTLGRWTTASEIDLVLEAVPARDHPASTPGLPVGCASSSSTSTARWCPRVAPAAPPSPARSRRPTARPARSTATTSAAGPICGSSTSS